MLIMARGGCTSRMRTAMFRLVLGCLISIPRREQRRTSSHNHNLRIRLAKWNKHKPISTSMISLCDCCYNKLLPSTSAIVFGGLP